MGSRKEVVKKDQLVFDSVGPIVPVMYPGSFYIIVVDVAFEQFVV